MECGFSAGYKQKRAKTMKQNSQAAFDNYIAARWKRAGAFLGQMMIMDQVRDRFEMETVITETLRDIGEYTEGDRVYLFDRAENGDYRNIARWNRNGVPAYTENVLHPEQMPHWLQQFAKGEHIFIRDLEQEKDAMPVEYPILKAQGVRSGIAALIFYRRQLAGFIGVDNPKAEVSELFIQQLSFIGSHLYSARKNQSVVDQLEQELQAKEKERQVLTVLCQDSTSVYRVNLLTNTAEIVKLAGGTHTEEMLKNRVTAQLCYTFEMQTFYDSYVLKESAPDYMAVFEPQNLMRLLADSDTFHYRFQMHPNSLGQSYMEIRATKLAQNERTFQILLDFRHIDEIVREERKQRKELEAALQDARMNNAVISAISKIYFAIYRINLKEYYFEKISCENTHHRLTGLKGDAARQIRAHDRYRVAEKFREHVAEFFDLTTLGDRLRHEESIAVEYPIVDGNWHMARFIVQTRDEMDNVEQVLCVVRQISDEKRREEQWMLAANEANAANKAKSEFLSRMSHDIRTPMNVIMGFVQIAKDNASDPDKVADCLRKIQLSGEDLQQLIDDVLDIARIESGEFRIESVPVDLCKLVTSFGHTMQSATRGKNIAFHIDLHDIAHNILLTDQMRLRQIYTNLLSNAAKYTQAGGKIKFEVYEETLPDTDRIRLVSIVRDTGIGMDAEHMKQMFTQFSRAVDTRVNKVRGSGLGLSIVKKIVDLMDGQIDVQSKPGEGTTFRVAVDLPFSAGDTVPDAQPEQAVTLPVKPLTLLIAEDNELNYEIVAEQLVMRGIHCVRAENGAECVREFEHAAADDFDAILMDMQMPEMNGPEAAAAIRASGHPAAKRIPIIALTANAYREDIEKCLHSGMNAHLSKPININHVLRTVVDLLPKQ